MEPSVTALDSIYIPNSLCLRTGSVVVLNTNDLLIRTSNRGAVIHQLGVAISLSDQVTDIVYKRYHPSYQSPKLAVVIERWWSAQGLACRKERVGDL